MDPEQMFRRHAALVSFMSAFPEFMEEIAEGNVSLRVMSVLPRHHWEAYVRMRTPVPSLAYEEELEGIELEMLSEEQDPYELVLIIELRADADAADALPETFVWQDPLTQESVQIPIYIANVGPSGFEAFESPSEEDAARQRRRKSEAFEIRPEVEAFISGRVSLDEVAGSRLTIRLVAFMLYEDRDIRIAQNVGDAILDIYDAGNDPDDVAVLILLKDDDATPWSGKVQGIPVYGIPKIWSSRFES